MCTEVTILCMCAPSMYQAVQRNIVFNSLKMKISQMPIISKMDKVWYFHVLEYRVYIYIYKIIIDRVIVNSTSLF